jgi:ubiquinone/menaquinone biosynthesis C-methylase UbiE
MALKTEPIQAMDEKSWAYFDVLAAVGHTKHLGGARATQELLELCDIGLDKHLLYVGCGAGASVVYIAKTYGCRITAVDVHPQMVAETEERVKRLGVGGSVEFKVADAQDLPFEADTFDILICESVNSFVPDLEQAAREYGRVIKPGGYVGLNEAVWVGEPTDDMETGMEDMIGSEIRRSAVWEKMLTDASLEDHVVRIKRLEMRKESGSQIQVMGWQEMLRIMGRILRVTFRDQKARSLYKRGLQAGPKAYIEKMGYGLYVGRKPGLT